MKQELPVTHTHILWQSHGYDSFINVDSAFIKVTCGEIKVKSGSL